MAEPEGQLERELGRARELREQAPAGLARRLPQQHVRRTDRLCLQQAAQRVALRAQQVPESVRERDGILGDGVEVHEDALAGVARHHAHGRVEHHGEAFALQDRAPAGGAGVQHLLQRPLRGRTVLAQQLARDERVRLHD